MVGVVAIRKLSRRNSRRRSVAALGRRRDKRALARPRAESGVRKNQVDPPLVGTDRWWGGADVVSPARTRPPVRAVAAELLLEIPSDAREVCLQRLFWACGDSHGGSIDFAASRQRLRESTHRRIRREGGPRPGRGCCAPFPTESQATRHSQLTVAAMPALPLPGTDYSFLGRPLRSFGHARKFGVIRTLTFGPIEAR